MIDITFASQKVKANSVVVQKKEKLK